MTRVGIIGLRAGVDYNRKIAKYLENLGIDSDVLIAWDLEISNRISLPDWNLVYIRFSGIRWTLELAKQLDFLGYRLLNGIDYYEKVSNKYLSGVLANKAGVRTPISYLIPTTTLLMEKTKAIAGAIGYPLILKPQYSMTQGADVFKIENPDDLEDRLNRLRQLDGVNFHDFVLLQEYIFYQKLIRVFQIEDEIIDVVYNKPSDSNWKCSVCNNPDVKILDYHDIRIELIEFCTKIAEVFGGKIRFIDLFLTEDGLVFNELNLACNFVHQERVTGTNYAKLLAEEIARNVDCS